METDQPLKIIFAQSRNYRKSELANWKSYFYLVLVVLLPIQYFRKSGIPALARILFWISPKCLLCCLRHIYIREAKPQEFKLYFKSLFQFQSKYCWFRNPLLPSIQTKVNILFCKMQFVICYRACYLVNL